jgi:hypothetical protein
MSKIKLIYVAVVQDSDQEFDVIATYDNKEELEKYIMDYFGINPDKHYDSPAEYLGFTKFSQPDEGSDICLGYYSFLDMGEKSNVFIYENELNEPIL